MLRTLIALAVFGLAACSPSLNWREVRTESGGLKAMLPCKPDKATRAVPLGDRQVELRVLGCEASGAAFVVMHGDVKNPLSSGQVLAQWKMASLANLRATRAEEGPFLPPGGMALRQSVRVSASGQRGDGSKVDSEAAYFARGSHVFHVAIYADRVAPDVARAFFDGLKFE